MIVNIIGIIIGILVAIGGIYYSAKEKHDEESRKIYRIVTIIGIIIVIVFMVK